MDKIFNSNINKKDIKAALANLLNIAKKVREYACSEGFLVKYFDLVSEKLETFDDNLKSKHKPNINLYNVIVNTVEYQNAPQIEVIFIQGEENNYTELIHTHIIAHPDERITMFNVTKNEIYNAFYEVIKNLER